MTRTEIRGRPYAEIKTNASNYSLFLIYIYTTVSEHISKPNNRTIIVIIGWLYVGRNALLKENMWPNNHIISYGNVPKITHILVLVINRDSDGIHKIIFSISIIQ